MPSLFSLINKFRREFKPVKGEGCKSSVRQLEEIMQLLLRCQLTPEEYFDYRFYLSDRDYSYMLNYISNYQLIYQYRAVLEYPDWFPILGYKLLFNFYYKSFNLPVTKVIFTGKQLPYWPEIKDLCLKATQITPFCRSVGWDLGITSKGPVLIEGNHGHGLNSQALTDGFLQKDVRDSLKDFGLEFYEKELPRFELPKFFKAARIWAGYKT